MTFPSLPRDEQTGKIGKRLRLGKNTQDGTIARTRVGGEVGRPSQKIERSRKRDEGIIWN